MVRRKYVHYILTVAFVFLDAFTVAAGNNRVELRGSYDYVIPDDMSSNQAYINAIHLAKNQVIANKFGSVISQVNTVITSNTNNKSNEHFFALSNDFVRGEWISDIEKPLYTIITDGLKQVIRVTVHGYAREIKSAKVDIKATPLRLGTDLRHAGYEFNNGDDLYLYFRSPADGYVTVFLIDETLMSQENEAVFCILPYKESGDGAFAVKHDTDYVLFSEEKATGNPEIVDRLVMTASRSVEYNNLLIVFSPNSFSKPNTTGELQNKGELILPRSLKYSEFKKWLTKYRDIDQDMQVLGIPLIVKNEK